MERQRDLDDGGYKFRNVQIFKSQELGHGSYGAVYKAKCDSLPCAAKLIYPVLFGSNVPEFEGPPQEKEHRQPMRRFEAECRFLSQIKHPNIVQYLGVYREPDTNVPILLMELMDESLTHFLGSSQTPLLFHLQVNILYDIALALAFLHTNSIHHRDMSSNNVLLIAGCRAKVTDFGMSTLTDAAASHLASLTQCPGTPAYMSPEALDEPPVYSEKLDCFSFGVLAIQVLTRLFPKPTDKFQNREVFDSLQPSRKFIAKVPIPEFERRQNHINLIYQDHPLLSTALNCIKDSDIERPTAEELCGTLEELKSLPLYAAALEQVRDNVSQLETLRQTIQDKELEICTKDTQIQLLECQIEELKSSNVEGKMILPKLERKLEDQDEHILSKQEELQALQQENLKMRELLKLKNQQIIELQEGQAHSERRIEDLLCQLQHLEVAQQQQEAPKLMTETQTTKFNYSWQKGPKAPVKMYKGSSVAIGNMAYFNPWDSQEVYTFDGKKWSSLQPQCPYKNFTLTSINNQVTAVGGMDPDSWYTISNKIYTYSTSIKTWVEKYPSMIHKRSRASVLSSRTHVFVMGGESGGRKLTSTEVMEVRTKQWSRTHSLPYWMHQASAALCGDVLYLIGGYTESNDYSVLSCSISDLLKPPRPGAETHSENVWRRISDLPVKYSTCVTINGQLLVVGGAENKDFKSTVYKYNVVGNSWNAISKINVSRHSCLVAALPDNVLFVVGGSSPDSGGWTDETELGMLVN